VRRILLDVNVVLDALLARPPHADPAMRLWAAVEEEQVAGLLPAHAVTTLFYLLSRAKGPASARRAVGDLLAVFRVATVDQAILQRALTLAWADFEDAVCAAAAEAAGCDLIVTRDPAGFKGSPVPTVDAAAALALLDRGGGPSRAAERPRTIYATKRNASPRPLRARAGRRVTATRL
jgi:predicted nucleic acid-binding protein